MKGISRYEGPKEGNGWLARTQWRGMLRRRRFSDSGWGGKSGARRAATSWLRTMNDYVFHKPTTDRWIRSAGAWGRAGKRGKWNHWSAYLG